jgi:hypothetical protein
MKYTGSTTAIAKYSLRRHQMQCHSKPKHFQTAARRLEMARRYKATARVAKRSGPQIGRNVAAFIICPRVREYATSLYSLARRSFMEHGFPGGNVHRLLGVDPAKPVPRSFAPKDMQRHCMLSAYFLRRFVPKATKLFKARPTLRAVLWVEDDCELLGGNGLSPLLCALPGKLSVWAGFYPLRGPPKYGAQVLAFSRQSLKTAFVAVRREYDSGAANALDNIFLELIKRGEVTALPQSIARQRKHALKGRRVPSDIAKKSGGDDDDDDYDASNSWAA